jgi:trehalose-6-phosphate synthase
VAAASPPPQRPRAKRVLVVSNRLPFSVQRTDQGVELVASAGGLVSALSGYLQRRKLEQPDVEFVWTGWAGADLSAEETERLRADAREKHGAYPLSLDAADMDRFYHGFCNGTLWPQGVLGADLMGFHTHDYAQHFLHSVFRTLGYEHYLGQINVAGALRRVETFPIGIDYARFSEAAASPEVAEARARMVTGLAQRKVIFSVDRLDYSKGILHRLRGFEAFLSASPEYHVGGQEGDRAQKLGRHQGSRGRGGRRRRARVRVCRR